ncbi:MAG: DUF58 domain-containing protein [Candidatus Brocadiia bacterium]
MVEDAKVRELVSRVRRLRMEALRPVQTRLAGAYASTFRGPGIEFSDFQPYEPGRDARHIDWQVTARRGTPYVRRYVEERRLQLVLLFDVSRSMDCVVRARNAPGGQSARERAALIAAALGLCAVRNGDSVGAILFADGPAGVIPPRGGEPHALHVLGRILGTRPAAGTTDLRRPLQRLLNLRGHALVVLLSDFLLSPPLWSAQVRRALATCARQHTVAAVHLTMADDALPGGVVLEGCEAETQESPRIDLHATDRINRHCRQHRRSVHRGLMRAGVRDVAVSPADDPLWSVAELLHQR